jgi:hypothetical protein
MVKIFEYAYLSEAMHHQAPLGLVFHGVILHTHSENGLFDHLSSGCVAERESDRGRFASGSHRL